eukprot:9190129-Pyramimonas_sp.AAC.1
MTKKPKGENDDLRSSPLVRGFYRPGISLPRTNSDRVQGLDELVVQDKTDYLAQNLDADFIKSGVRTREQRTLTPSSERGRSSKAPRARRSSSQGFNALKSPR